MRRGKSTQSNWEVAKSGALARLTGELEKLRSSDPDGYDPYNSSGRFRQIELDTDIVPALEMPVVGVVPSASDPKRGA